VLYKYILMVLDDCGIAFVVGRRGVKRRSLLSSRNLCATSGSSCCSRGFVAAAPLIIVMTRRVAAASRLVFDKMTRDDATYITTATTTDRPLQRARGHDEDVIAAAVCDCCCRIILTFYDIITSACAIGLRFKTAIGECSSFITEFRVPNSEMNRRGIIQLWRVLRLRPCIVYYNVLL